jgi:hypothetical protein
MRIEYIFIIFLHFTSYNIFKDKIVFWFKKDETSLQKRKKKLFGMLFFFLIASIKCHIFNKYIVFFTSFNVKTA